LLCSDHASKLRDDVLPAVDKMLFIGIDIQEKQLPMNGVFIIFSRDELCCHDSTHILDEKYEVRMLFVSDEARKKQ
jgi:hypothetical protein